MAHGLTALGKATIAVLLVTAATASAAQATSYHVESAPATLTGSVVEGSSTFGFGETKLKCKSETLTGTLSSTVSSSISLLPTFSGCTLAGSSAEVHVNECQFVSQLEGETGSFGFSCPTGKEMVIEVAPACDIQWEPKQSGIPKYSVKNTTGPPEDIDEILTVTGLAYVVKDCPFVKDGTYTNGELSKTWTIKADKGGGAQQPIWVE